MRINNNIMAMNAHRQLAANQANASKSMEKLSSGYRINRAGDDAAGLAISEKMRSQIRGLQQASRNAQDGISLIQTAEGTLNETHTILRRMRELAVQSATDTNTLKDRSELQKEVDQLAKEISRISNTTEFNTKNLMAGGLNILFHIGANEQQNVTLGIGAMDAQSLGVAASSIANSLTPADGILGISDVNEILGEGAKVVVSHAVDASATVSNASTGGTTTIGGVYTGHISETLTYEINGVTGSQVDSILVGGGIGEVGRDAQGRFAIRQGIYIEIADDASNAVGQGGNINLTAKSFDISLANNDGTLGSRVTVVNNNVDRVTVGDPGTGRTGTVHFNFANLAINAGIDITQVETGSTSASVDAFGQVVTRAVVQRGINISTQSNADKAIKAIDKAVERVSTERAQLGAMQNRLEHTIANLGTSAENLQAAESRIRDLDMAEEIMGFTKEQILQQAATAMLAQANMAPQTVLQLLG